MLKENLGPLFSITSVNSVMNLMELIVMLQHMFQSH